MDLVGKYENFEKDFKKIAKKLQINLTTPKMIKLNMKNVENSEK